MRKISPINADELGCIKKSLLLQGQGHENKTRFKGIVQRKLTGIESFINQKVFHSN
jgi:hypothetical protein